MAFWEPSLGAEKEKSRWPVETAIVLAGGRPFRRCMALDEPQKKVRSPLKGTFARGGGDLLLAPSYQ